MRRWSWRNFVILTVCVIAWTLVVERFHLALLTRAIGILTIALVTPSIRKREAK